MTDAAAGIAARYDSGGRFRDGILGGEAPGGVGRLCRHASRDQVVLVYFGYTHCPDVCPTTLGLITDALVALGPDARRVLPVFVTLDPRRDTASVLRDYLANFAPPPLGLTADPARIAAAVRDWDVTWRPAEGGAYIDHSSVVTAVGRDGRVRLRYGFSQLQSGPAVARDLLHLLHDT